MSDRINFAWPVTTFNKADWVAFESFLEKQKEVLNSKKIVIFGSGIRGTKFGIHLKKRGYTDIVFTDNNEKKVGGCINKFPIISVKEMLKMKSEIVIIISTENGTSIKMQLRELGFCEDKDFFTIETQLYKNYVNYFLQKDNTDIMLLGDCGITELSLQDEKTEHLGELIQNEIGADKLKVLAMHAMGMRAYYTIFKAHLNYIAKPKCVVLMTNMEVFTGKQHILPRSQHAKLIAGISAAIDNKDPELLEYVAVTQERTDNFRNDYFTSSEEALGGMSQDANNKIIIKMNYMFKMDMQNECIIYLQKFIDLCKEENIRLLLFIPPANYQYAYELWGERFDEKYNINVKVLEEIAQRNNVKIIDFSYSLESDKFAAISTIDETLNQYGREIIASRLSEEIKHMYDDIVANNREDVE